MMYTTWRKAWKQSTQASHERYQAARQRRGHRRLLELETLEDRLVPTIVFPLTLYGDETIAPGSTNVGLQNPTVNLIFAGNWTNYQQDETTLINASRSIVTGPYLSGLAQYSTSGMARFGTFWNDPNNTPNATLPGSPNADT